MLRRALLAGLAALALGGTAEATVYQFTGTVSFGGNDPLAAAFGAVTGDSFTALLDFDDSQTIVPDAIITLSGSGSDFSYTRAYYDYDSFSWSLGSVSWAYNGSFFSGDWLTVLDGDDGTSDVSDSLRVEGTSSNHAIAGGSITQSRIESYNWDETFLTTADASAIGAWNEVAAGSNSGQIYTTIGTIRLSNISMTVLGGVPEPATWLMMIMGFGFVAVAARRRKGAVAA
ncbi:PEPxxWA-CTERM sorting domain-containing protein [Gimibacter soli]|uniref:PEPxxWA-CTERM sorting domain-containing protein n=1 Tax=Gimibacter soli TaxID=3024400 RepID=A0AAE9XW94_9PROT|nr:PEPxxWA-CTERM sorting domain-containing protein [Gimibacter soli]WCL54399.1 PEPxxWA-CTERM sorting domain-containing protein [Gimibacter soli]